MSRPKAPSLPTEDQIRKAHETVRSLCPGARISKVGPDGVGFDYPGIHSHSPRDDRPFSADGS